MNVGIYGLGNFGYSLLKHLDKNNGARYTLHAFDRKQIIVDSLNTARKHPHIFPTARISNAVVVCRTVHELIEKCKILILAVNSDATRDIAKQIKQSTKCPVILVNTAKALDYQTGALLSTVLTNELGPLLEHYAVFSGGTNATDFFKHDPLGASLACSEPAVGQLLTDIFQSNELFVYPTADVAGVEGASAMKNIIAILAGITKGLGFSFGSETHLISRAASEAEQLIKTHFGGQDSTFRLQSQCWGNDLWMSSLGDTRNRMFGILVGKLQSFKLAKEQAAQMNMTVEGINTLTALRLLPNIERYPIFFTLDKLSRQKISFDEFRLHIFTQQL